MFPTRHERSNSSETTRVDGDPSAFLTCLRGHAPRFTGCRDWLAEVVAVHIGQWSRSSEWAAPKGAAYFGLYFSYCGLVLHPGPNGGVLRIVRLWLPCRSRPRQPPARRHLHNSPPARPELGCR